MRVHPGAGSVGPGLRPLRCRLRSCPALHPRPASQDHFDFPESSRSSASLLLRQWHAPLKTDHRRFNTDTIEGSTTHCGLRSSTILNHGDSVSAMRLSSAGHETDESEMNLCVKLLSQSRTSSDLVPRGRALLQALLHMKSSRNLNPRINSERHAPTRAGGAER